MSNGNGKPLCWHGSKCRRMHDPEHCSKYDHQIRPCKFGAKCRRQGRGCKYSHPGEHGDQDAPLLNVRGSNNDNNRLGNDIESSTPEPERPVPFIFLLIGVCALGLLMFPVIGECQAARHKQMFHAGLVLTLPLILFELLLHFKRKWLLEKFLPGDYSERATFRELSFLWYPVPIQLLRYTSGDVAGNNIEQYATWETNDVQQQVEDMAGGNRDGGQIAPTPGSPGSFILEFPGEFAGSSATMDPRGNIEGLGVPVRFDGSNIVSHGGAWQKAGYWRLDFVTKALLLLSVLGLECCFVAALMPPGVSGVNELGRMPLKTVFVVDGSASITQEMWVEQQGAGEEFIKAFNSSFGGHPGDLNIGVVQFSTDAREELPVTSDVEAALTTLGSMQQMRTMTYYDKGLESCRAALDAYKPDVESFEVCVLITDGIDMSMKSAQALQEDVGEDTAIFGIFVGQDAKGQSLLQHLVSCGKAQHGGRACDFFASAQDYSALKSKAHDVADQVTKGLDLAMCAMVSALIGIPTALALCLPYILWYASCTGLTLYRRHHESNNMRNFNDNHKDNLKGMKGNNNFASNKGLP